MRKLIVLSLLGIVTTAAGCLPCGTRRPGYSMFGTRPNYQCCPQPAPCCDPCGGAGGAVMSGGGEMMMSPGPVMQQAPCCQ
jgi:hypothetical protein